MYQELDALPLEYKLHYRSTFRNANVPDSLNKSIPQGKVRIFCTGLPEESFDLFAFQRSLVSNYSPDFSVFSVNSV